MENNFAHFFKNKKENDEEILVAGIIAEKT